MGVSIAVLVFLFGACVGSFVNAAAYRMPRNLALANERSRCGRCKAQIAWYDNIPILSALLLCGRCRLCGVPYGLYHLWVEIALGLLALGIFSVWSHSFDGIYLFLLCSALMIVSLVDLEFQIIPDEISIGGTVIGLLLALLSTVKGFDWWVTIYESALGAVFASGLVYGVGKIYAMISGREGIGFGDVKLLALMGAHVGPYGSVLSLMLASVIGSLVGLFLMLRGSAGSKTAIPFGPFLVVGFLTYVAFAFGFLPTPELLRELFL